jgi:succinate dehydrogenase / fumarate reductase cytochrome b subunit
VKDARDALMVARNSDGKLISRPLSPHLQVYRWPISMALSILHRASGIALGVGTLLLTWWLVAAATSPEAFATAQGFIASPIGLLLLFGWTFALWFHFFSGLRHLAWDMGYGFEQRMMNKVSYLVLGASIVATLLVWAVGYAAMGG